MSDERMTELFGVLMWYTNIWFDFTACKFTLQFDLSRMWQIIYALLIICG